MTELINAWEQIKQNQSVRSNLSEIRRQIKQEETFDAWITIFDKEYSLVIALLQNEDAKTRKNAALLLGDSADGVYFGAEIGKEILEALKTAYENEKTLFVKSSYLQAFTDYDYREYLAWLHKEHQRLLNFTQNSEKQKHIHEQIHMISHLILQMEGNKKHLFCGEHILSDYVLVCDRTQIDYVAEQIQETLGVDCKTFSAGVMLQTDRLEDLLSIRIYHDLFYRIRHMTSLEADAAQAAKTILQAGFLQFLEERHQNVERTPYTFRVELKSKEADKHAKFMQKFIMELEHQSKGKLVNSISSYEVELRLIENKNGGFNCLVKLFTIKDERFAYRKESIATSMKPVHAALAVSLASPYMKKDAQVLDPFCGVATLLIERHKKVQANTTYGIDVFQEAIEKAKMNVEAAGQIVHFIQKDFFDFTHTYLFDEVITDMPFVTKNRSEQEIYQIYVRFFAQIPRYLKEDSVVILYTHNREWVEKLYHKNFEKLEHFRILEKAGTDLYILKKKLK